MQNNAKAVNVEEYANDTVRLTCEVKHVTSGIDIIEGEVSSSGKTISVEGPVNGDTVRLKTEKILGGEREYRSSMMYQLYTPEEHQQSQRSNHAPGPQVGVDEVNDVDDLPPATHEA